MKKINTKNYYLNTKANFEFKGFVSYQKAWKHDRKGNLVCPIQLNKGVIKKIIETKLNTKIRHSFTSHMSIYFYANNQLIRVSNHWSKKGDCARIRSCWWELKNVPTQKTHFQTTQIWEKELNRTSFQIGVVPFAEIQKW